jgi:hypothetical protein
MTVKYITKAFLGCRGGWRVYLIADNDGTP